MSIFVSYARADRDVVRLVEQDLERTRSAVWIDNELDGGQAWWDVILGKIRESELFVFALSPDSLNSRACMAELTYAVQLGRPLLGVMVRPVSVQLAPRELADTHIVDYTERTPENAVSLVTAVMSRQPPPPLPDPLPSPPPTPLSYLNPFREQVHAPDLTYQQQAQLVIALRGHLADDDARATTRQLLADLRRRPDIVESVGRDIDSLLADAGSGAGGPPSPSDPGRPANWYPDPVGRFTHRYWDGSGWTEHVSSPQGVTSDPLASAPTASTFASAAGSPLPPPGGAEPGVGPGAAPGSGPTGAPAGDATDDKPAFDTGVFVILIIGSVLIGLIGVVVGATNLKYPARNGQAKVLLAVGIAMFVLTLLLLGGG